MQMYEAAHKAVKLVIKKNFTNERDNCDQVLFRLLLKEGHADFLNGKPTSWVHTRAWVHTAVAYTITCLHSNKRDISHPGYRVCACEQVASVRLVTHRVAIEKIRLRERVVGLVQSAGITHMAYFAHGHINGHHYRVPLREREETHRKSSFLLAYESTADPNTAIHFGHLAVFVQDLVTDTNYAVVARRQVVRHSTDPFYVCVCPLDDVCHLVLVPVSQLVCACSEMVLHATTPPMSMVLFHQLSGSLHPFE